MEARTSLNQTLPRNGIGGKENPKRGLDQKIALMGSAVKRKRLSDITNTMSSSRLAIPDAQFQEKPKEVACGITKGYIGQLMEENATLLKALRERNKIIELSNIEMQKLRLIVEKANQQNRMLAQANSQMLAELTSNKERLKTLQHELGCTVAVLRLKNLALDEKEKLNKELSEKVVQEGRSKLVEVATDVRQAQSVCNTTACRLDGISQSNEEKLDNELCEKMKTEENSTFAEVATAAALSLSLSNGMVCNPNRRHTLRNKSSTTLPQEAEEKVTNELHVKTRAEEERLNRELCENDSVEEERLNRELCENDSVEEERSECAKAATDASLSHAVDNNMSCEPNRKQTLRSQSLGAAAAVTHQVVEAKEKDARRKSSRKRSNNLTSEVHVPKDNLPETENLEVPACPVINEPPIEDNTFQTKPSATTSRQVEAEEKDETRMTSRRRSNNLTSKTRESQDNETEIENVKVLPACPVIIEPPNEINLAQAKSPATVSSQVEAEEKDDARTRKSSRRRSSNLTSEARESKDNLPEVDNVEVPACPVISELPNEDNPVQAKSSATVMSQIEAAERDDARTRKSSRRRSSNQKSELCESKDHFLETADVKNPACPPIIEPLNKDNPVQERTSAPLKHEESKVQQDQPTSSQRQGQELRRTSVGRPMRRAAEKVCSYKEVPLNVKMRRSE